MKIYYQIIVPRAHAGSSCQKNTHDALKDELYMFGSEAQWHID